MICCCWKCKTKNEFERKLSFRATCIKCSRDLHVCLNCSHHMQVKPNECNIPNTDPVYDREKYNFCEEFSPKCESESSPPSSDSAFRVFGEKPPSNKSFDDLFDKD